MGPALLICAAVYVTALVGATVSFFSVVFGSNGMALAERWMNAAPYGVCAFLMAAGLGACVADCNNR